MKHWITLLLAGCTLLGLAGCTSDAVVISQGLRIVVQKIERTGPGAYEVSWRVTNPNVVTYVLDRSTHKLFLDGVAIGSVTQRARMGIPANNTAEGVSPLVLAGPGAEEKLTQAIAAGSAAYRVDSVIWLLLIDDDVSKSQLTSTGNVPVTAK